MQPNEPVTSVTSSCSVSLTSSEKEPNPGAMDISPESKAEQGKRSQMLDAPLVQGTMPLSQDPVFWTEVQALFQQSLITLPLPSVEIQQPLLPTPYPETPSLAQLLPIQTQPPPPPPPPQQQLPISLAASPAKALLHPYNQPAPHCKDLSLLSPPSSPRPKTKRKDSSKTTPNLAPKRNIKKRLGRPPNASRARRQTPGHNLHPKSPTPPKTPRSLFPPHPPNSCGATTSIPNLSHDLLALAASDAMVLPTLPNTTDQQSLGLHTLHTAGVVVPASRILNIDPVEYVADTFDKVIFPIIKADSPIKQSIHAFVYRKFICEIARQESTLNPPSSLNDLCLLVTHCFSSASLL